VVVVYLAIKRGVNSLVTARHWLSTSLEVNDREPYGTEMNVLVTKLATAIWTAVIDRGHHSMDNRRMREWFIADSKNAYKAAHIDRFPLLRETKASHARRQHVT